MIDLRLWPWLWLASLPALAQTPQMFVAMQPCRVAATPWPVGPFGGPTLAANSTRSFALPQGACGIPSNASAYSLNLTAIPKEPLNYMTIWPTGIKMPNVSVLNAHEGQVLANAAIVPAGTNGAISVFVTNQTDLLIDINGYFIPQSDSASQNTAVGSSASSAGTFNTGVGYNALQSNTGSNNTVTGVGGLSLGNSGNNNVAVGFDALLANTLGAANTAVGSMNMVNNSSGKDNTAAGYSALSANTQGNSNTAVGMSALSGNTFGSYNVAVGYGAGGQITTGSNNVDIANPGGAGDSGIMRIGTDGVQQKTFIAGINNVRLSGGVPVLIDATGQLGTIFSSRRYKEDIADMADSTSKLFELRPVTFRYKHVPGTPAGALQYGLIAEEVARVYPELVVYDQDGREVSVQYQQLPSMLLNELQKEHRTLAAQRARIEALEARVAKLEKLLAADQRLNASAKK